MEEAVQFSSDGIRCSGLLYRAASAGSAPCVVLCPGFGGTQDTPSMIAAATAFAESGLTAMTFDYRGFGRSAGADRQVVDLAGQRADIGAAIRFARGRPDIDARRIALWGTSLGGGHVITVAAEDPAVAAVVAQVPFNGFPKRVEGRSVTTTLRLLTAILRDRVRGRLSRAPYYIPAIGARGDLAVISSDEARQAVADMNSPTWRNEVAPRALLDMMTYRPGRHASRLAMPVLVCVGIRDRETRGGEQIAELAPRGVLRRYPLSHFDFYRPDLRRRVLDDQVAFLSDALSESETSNSTGESR
ncbi:alpha/beta hydrolase [Mycolicibacterium flavescens]|uniref:Alpha/beta hydrolase n=1 Tax=Mycolicibacterium flavescens TaxID=1776 RepID=A0A1E3RJL6_MYCFV|nr:alpha/beta hydrolase [Mycolicibacterium flavescens]